MSWKSQIGKNMFSIGFPIYRGCWPSISPRISQNIIPEIEMPSTSQWVMWFLKTATHHDVVLKNHVTPQGLKKPTTSLLLFCWGKPRHSYKSFGANHTTPTNLWGKPRHSYKSLGQTTSLLQIFGANQVTPTNLWGKPGYSYKSLGQIRLLLWFFGANPNPISESFGYASNTPRILGQFNNVFDINPQLWYLGCFCCFTVAIYIIPHYCWIVGQSFW